MVTSHGEATWTDTLRNGSGTMESASFEAAYSFAGRFEDGPGVSPEELIADAHAGCYSMALAHELEEAGYVPGSVRTSAEVHFDPGALAITDIELRTEAQVENIDEDTFEEIAEAAKEGCPVSKALAGSNIELVAAELTSGVEEQPT